MAIIVNANKAWHLYIFARKILLKVSITVVIILAHTMMEHRKDDLQF